MKQVMQLLDGDADLPELPHISVFGAFSSDESSLLLSWLLLLPCVGLIQS
jgi:hypothetical protein